MAASPSFCMASLLLGIAAALMACDPFRLSPIAGVPGFTAKRVELPDAARLASFPRDAASKLQRAELQHAGQVMGPESLAFDSLGRGPYTGMADGRIMRWGGPGHGWTQFATVYPSGSQHCKPQSPPAVNLTYEHVCGRPLGLRFSRGTGELFIADAYFGLLVVGPDGGEAKVVVDEADGVRLGFTNDLDIASDGTVFFTDSSTAYQRRKFLLVILSGDDSGRIMSYNPSTRETKVLYRGLRFANGVALSKDESFLVVSESTSCRLLRFWLKGENKGTLETFAELPGLPDNVRANDKGEFWVAIHCRRSLSMSIFASNPWLVKPFLKLPFSMKLLHRIFLGRAPHAMALRYDADGNLLEVLEDQTGKVVKLISEVEERDGKLWMGSVLLPHIAIYSR